MAQRRPRTVAAISDDTLMSVAAWAEAIKPTEEEAAVTVEQVLSRTSWDAPSTPAELPSFIGSSETDSTWARTERPEDKDHAAPPARPQRPAGGPAPAKNWFDAEKVLSLLNPDQQSVLEDVKIQLVSLSKMFSHVGRKHKESKISLRLSLPNLSLSRRVRLLLSPQWRDTGFVLLWTQLTPSQQWANLLDYETLSWERIEKEVNRGLFTVPTKPFTEYVYVLTNRLILRGRNSSVTLFVNSHHFEPRSGSRSICATLWLHLHYILAKYVTYDMVSP